MTYTRTRLLISGINGGNVKGDTGILYGRLEQFRWYPTALDTGTTGTLALAVLPGAPGAADTGPGFTAFEVGSLNFGAGFTRAPRQKIYFSDGTLDTGAAYVVGAGDRLRAKVTPGDTGMVIDGALYVWTRQ